MPLDPVISLASTLHAAPGTFALLVGSGVSRSAQIPTGWDVITDLARRMAILKDRVEPDDPIAWLIANDGGAPNYSALLEQLAPTAADRRNLLNGYFEPSQEEREQGVKVPTRAHRAIARLVAGGYVRVIVTTNFDRLLEAAVREAGIEPVVISSAAAAAGALPLAHTRCTILKVHGDYLDPDLKNTVQELDHYDEAVDRLLDQVFDEYGLLVCGWSGEWDEALRAALLRAPSRRYGVWWAHVGEVGERAAQVVAHRGAIEIAISGADEFFESVVDKVDALAEAADRRPLSTALAVAQLKRYLPDPVHRIRLHDLVMAEVHHALEIPLKDGNTPHPNVENVSARMREFEGACATLLPLLATLGLFADRDEHDRLLVEAIRRLALRRRVHGGYNVWIELELYPALLALYTVGLGVLSGHRLKPLAAALIGVDVPHPNGKQPLMVAVSSWSVLDAQVCNAIVVEPGKSHRTPVSEYLHRVLREPLRSAIGSDDEYSDRFDEFEYLVGVVSTDVHGRGPVGRFVWRRRHEADGQGNGKFEQYADQLLSGGLFDGSKEKLAEAQVTYNERLHQSGLAW